MKPQLLLLSVTFTLCALAGDTPARRNVGRPASDIFGSAYMATFFPPNFARLDSTALKRGEVRIRIVHRGIATSSPKPSSKGIAAEICGLVGQPATVLADHDHEGFEWKKRVLSKSEFETLAATVLDETFLSLKQIRPIGLGSRVFHIEVLTEHLHGRFTADWLDEPPDAHERMIFRRVASAIMKAGGFEEREISW